MLGPTHSPGLATSAYGTLGRTLVESLKQLSIDRAEEVLQLMTEPSWMDPIILYLTDRTSPEDPVEAKRLYKRSFSLLLLRCLGPTDADYALREVHEGICRSHLGANPWPTKSYGKITTGPP